MAERVLKMEQKALRAPAYPLIVIDPYTSLWSMGDKLAGDTVKHWTGKPNTLVGTAEIDGKLLRFMGSSCPEAPEEMMQTHVEFDSFSTRYTFEYQGVELGIDFTSPLIPGDRMLMSRPVSYINASVRSLDGAPHTVAVQLTASSQLCLSDKDDRKPVIREKVSLKAGLTGMRMGGIEQPVLGRCGDDVCIDWGYLYLAACGQAEVGASNVDSFKGIFVKIPLDTVERSNGLFLLAYDDIESITYFGDRLQAYWKKDGQTIGKALEAACSDYEKVLERCRSFDEEMKNRAEAAGGQKYAELLQLALRQVMGAHKLVVDKNGDLLYISKECFSNGCGATADVSYPSMPLFLLYDPEMVLGMMRPIFRYAESSAWPYSFAPHDAGTYPILNGQVYSGGTDIEWQMPIEECGNMLIMAAAAAKALNSADAFTPYRDCLNIWAEYLLENGLDPDNQLCTDDFAGHLSHNCNLSIKAILGLAAYALLCDMWKEVGKAETYLSASREMAKAWLKKAANGDGSYRLAFDQPHTFSMKYNAVWDKIWNLGLFPKEAIAKELESYKKHMNPYGLPLDSREAYTKSDWVAWAASLAESREEFIRFIEPMWLAYHLSPSRVPLGDWYSTITSQTIMFQNRTVQGGIWIRLLMDS